jgi:hypothetical protein
MVMRYHWGLAVGHTYSHATAADSSVVHGPTTDTHEDDDLALESNLAGMPVDILPQNEETLDHHDPELGFEDREDHWTDVGEDDNDDGIIDDEEFLELNDMYGLSYT